MTLEERMERLEKLVGKVLAEDELIGIHIERLMDILIEYWQKMGDYRYGIGTTISIYRGALERLEKEWQEHYKHHSYSDKKTKGRGGEEYIYSSIKTEDSGEKSHTN